MNERESTSTAIVNTNESRTGAATLIKGRLTAEKVNEQLELVIAYYEIVSKKQREQDGKIESQNGKIEKFEKLQQENTFRMIEIVGIFSALLGFIVFEAQIFKATQSTLTLVGLTSVMLGALISFVLLLDLAFDGFKTSRNLRIFLACLAVACIVCGFWAANIGYKNGDYNLYLTEKEVIIEIDKRINESQNATTTTTIQKDDTQLLEFKNCILKNGLARCL